MACLRIVYWMGPDVEAGLVGSCGLELSPDLHQSLSSRDTTYHGSIFQALKPLRDLEAFAR